MTDLLDSVKNYKAIGLGSLVLILLGGGILFGLNHVRPEPKPIAFPEVAKEELATRHEKETQNLSTAEEASEEVIEVVVDVKGAVVSEGVYHLPAGSRVTDAIKAAGGFTETADKKSVNLAQKISDEGVIYVAVMGENISAIPDQATGGSSSSAGQKINLNKATLADLTTISGIGEKRAQDIIAYRDSKGGFSAVEELTNVSGIGEKTLERLKSEVSVD